MVTDLDILEQCGFTTSGLNIIECELYLVTYKFSTVAADILATQRVRASAAMVTDLDILEQCGFTTSGLNIDRMWVVPCNI